MKTAFDLGQELAAIVEERSKIYNGNDSPNYAFAFGYISSELSCMLSNLELTDEQYAIVKQRVASLASTLASLKQS